ncbi:hypothetical protein [Domibacillus aminovorans]|uniref:ATP-binding protein n=1 Tax=Domibacillus aminovorans TaxID=29332 RepID=A0A177L3J6_9BACI|nr:hypothetical protein [Domibacillus aminovorans]OAH60260.1 hypothetical protein AWH49_17485 [Domibacillus aminovorans]
MRDVIQTNGLIIAADNSGAIGGKRNDLVRVPYETVGYFSARVALMECVAAGGEPFAAIIHNFSGDDAWPLLCDGIKQAAVEIGCTLELTGSTESNFVMNQSATGVVIIGRHVRNIDQFDRNAVRYGVIGKPLVGSEVLENPDDVASLAVFKKINSMPGVESVVPVGSKGIRYELEQLAERPLTCELDLEKSSGPATCFIIAVQEVAMKAVEQAAGIVYWCKI